MGKVQTDLRGVSGKVGNKSYFQSGGKTYVREIVPTHNPRTSAQTLQRVMVKAVGKSYGKYKTLCGHSFEGCSNGAKCAERFRSLNTRHLRERANTLQDSGQSLSQFYQFAPIQSNLWAPYAAIISEGHLPPVTVGIDAEGGHVAYVNSPGRTYADFVKAWGLQRGDQLTFVTVQKREDKYEVNYARLVLNPIVIHGQAHMVKAHGGDPLYIRFADEGIKMRVCCGDALGEPAAQIDAMLKTGKNPHGESPFLLNHYAYYTSKLN